MNDENFAPASLLARSPKDRLRACRCGVLNVKGLVAEKGLRLGSIPDDLPRISKKGFSKNIFEEDDLNLSLIEHVANKS